jgi:hypothetical protein
MRSCGVSPKSLVWPLIAALYVVARFGSLGLAGGGGGSEPPMSGNGFSADQPRTVGRNPCWDNVSKASRTSRACQRGNSRDPCRPWCCVEVSINHFLNFFLNRVKSLRAWTTAYRVEDYSKFTRLEIFDARQITPPELRHRLEIGIREERVFVLEGLVCSVVEQDHDMAWIVFASRSRVEFV